MFEWVEIIPTEIYKQERCQRSPRKNLWVVKGRRQDWGSLPNLLVAVHQIIWKLTITDNSFSSKHMHVYTSFKSHQVLILTQLNKEDLYIDSWGMSLEPLLPSLWYCWWFVGDGWNHSLESRKLWKCWVEWDCLL